MQNDPERPFPYQPQRLERIPGFNCRTGKLNLLDNQRLETLLDQLTLQPGLVSYPLQIRFYEKLMACDLLLPVPAQSNLSQGLPLMSLENSHGEKGLPLFTSTENLLEWATEPLDFVAMPFASLCGFALEARLDYVIINIAGPFGCEIALHDFSYLAEGLLPPPGPEQPVTGNALKPGEILITKQTPMRLGLCRNFPENLSQRLQQVFQHHQNMIEQVYLFDVAFNEGPLQPALGVRMPDALESQWETQLWPNLQAVLHEMLEKHNVVNVFLLNQAGGLEKHLQDLTQPIFQR